MFDLDQTVSSYIRAQIMAVKERYNVTTTELAEISGYERSAFHRLMVSNASISTKSLYRLSNHFGLSMDFWFPPREGIVVEPLPVPVIPPVQEAIPIMLPITRKMVKALNRVSMTEKRQLILLALKYPSLIAEAIKLAKLLDKVETSRRSSIISALQKIVKSPAP